MKKEFLLTEKEMQVCDKNTIERIGIDSMVLMERAALSVAEYIINMHKEMPNKKIIVIAGNGNNGADGIACARILSEMGESVCAYIIPSEAVWQPALNKQITIAKSFGVEFLEEFKPDSNMIIIDAIFGIGLNREVTGHIKELIATCNESGAKIVSVDIPSGVHAGTGKIMGCAIKADVTITFGFYKVGQFVYPGKKFCGKVFCKKMGINETSFYETLPKFFSYYKNIGHEKIDLCREPDANKGSFGKVLVIAGNENTPGAALLCCKAAFNSGCGMVSLYTAGKNRETIINALPEVMLQDRDSDRNRESLQKILAWCDVIAMGPGMGTTKEECDILEYVLMHSNKPLILDADAITILAENTALNHKLQMMQQSKDQTRVLIMTPHMGEMASFTGCTIGQLKENKLSIVEQYADTYQMTLICKDADTFVKGKMDDIYINTVGCDGMATAGSGDVLTGICASVLAQYIKKQEIPYERFRNKQQSDIMIKAFYASCMAVFLHGVAGEKAALSFGNAGCTATDILQEVKRLIK